MINVPGSDKAFYVGDLAKKAGLTPQAIRFYEQMGLLGKVTRTAAGYRIYDSTALARLRFIQRAQQFGFSLKEIKLLLSLDGTRRAPCRDVKIMLDAKVKELRKKMRELRELDQEVRRFRAACVRAMRRSDACPVIADFKMETKESKNL